MKNKSDATSQGHSCFIRFFGVIIDYASQGSKQCSRSHALGIVHLLSVGASRLTAESDRDEIDILSAQILLMINGSEQAHVRRQWYVFQHSY